MLKKAEVLLAMQMLAAGGVGVLADDQRLPDENNPRGHLESAGRARVLDLHYHEALADPASAAAKIQALLGEGFDAAAAAIHRSLHRTGRLGGGHLFKNPLLNPKQ